MLMLSCRKYDNSRGYGVVCELPLLSMGAEPGVQVRSGRKIQQRLAQIFKSFHWQGVQPRVIICYVGVILYS